MKRLIIPALIAVLGIPTVLGQSSIDALQLTSSDFKGTARFMGMGGAFTALGGDLATLTQNPAGIDTARLVPLLISIFKNQLHHRQVILIRQRRLRHIATISDM